MNQIFYRNLATRPSNLRPFWAHQFHLVFFCHSTLAFLVKTWTICGLSFVMGRSNLLADVLASILRISGFYISTSVLMDARYGRQHIELSHFHVPINASFIPYHTASIIYFLITYHVQFPILDCCAWLASVSPFSL
jgi:hypothetical protein